MTDASTSPMPESPRCSHQRFREPCSGRSLGCIIRYLDGAQGEAAGFTDIRERVIASLGGPTAQTASLPLMEQASPIVLRAGNHQLTTPYDFGDRFENFGG
jgi:hypothetical protein